MAPLPPDGGHSVLLDGGEAGCGDLHERSATRGLRLLLRRDGLERHAALQAHCAQRSGARCSAGRRRRTLDVLRLARRGRLCRAARWRTQVAGRRLILGGGCRRRRVARRPCCSRVAGYRGNRVAGHRGNRVADWRRWLNRLGGRWLSRVGPFLIHAVSHRPGLFGRGRDAGARYTDGFAYAADARAGAGRLGRGVRGIRRGARRGVLSALAGRRRVVVDRVINAALLQVSTRAAKRQAGSAKGGHTTNMALLTAAAPSRGCCE